MAGQIQPPGALSVNNDFYKVGDEIWIDTGGASGYYHLVTQEDLSNAQSKTALKITIAGIKALTGTLPTHYFSTTDAGQEGEWYYDADDTISAGNTGTILLTADGKRIKRVFSKEINLKWFGAKGDNSDATAAIDQALQFVASLSEDPIGGAGDLFYSRGPSLYVPSGRYVYNGGGFSRVPPQTKNLRIIGDGRDSSVISITTDVYFLSYGDITCLQVEDVCFIGGKGLFVQRANAGNVRRLFIIQRCDFVNFSQCAIGSNSTDMPNWKIKENRFTAKRSGSGPVIGIALSGLVDGCTIEDNEFFYCHYAVKLDRGGNNARIVGNFFPTPTVYGEGLIGASIWIVPGGTVINSGPGLTIDDNKMGNEFANTDITRILIADEDIPNNVTSHFYDRKHKTEISVGSFTGGQIINNLFTGFTGQTLGYVYSYTGNIGGLHYAGNVLVGTAPTYLFEFAEGVVFEGNINYESNLVDIPISHLLDSPGFRIRVSNLLGFAKVFDPLGVTSGSLDTAQLYNAQPADISYSLISNASGRSLTLSAATTLNETDVYGGDQAAEITFSASTGFAHTIAFLDSRINEGELIWVEVDLKKTVQQPLSYLNVFIKRNDAANYREQSRVVKVNDRWSTIRFQAIVNRKNGDPIRLMITPFAYSATSRIKVIIGQTRVYHANSPVNHSDLKIIGANAGAWNGPKLQMGNNRIWLDSMGQIRFNSVSPTNESDGLTLIPVKGITNIQRDFSLTTKNFNAVTGEIVVYSLGLISGHPRVVIELLVYSNDNGYDYQRMKEILITANNTTVANRVTSQSLVAMNTKYANPLSTDFMVTTAIESNLLKIKIIPDSGTLNFLIKGAVTASYNNSSGFLVTEN